MKYTQVVVTGSLAYDTIMSMPGKFRDHILPEKLHILNVSFIMKSIRREFGGTAGNISYNLSLLQIPSVLLVAAGNDFSSYKKHLRKFSQIDISRINEYKNIATACGFVMTDQEDNQIWGFFEGAMKHSCEISLQFIKAKQFFFVIAPNDVKAMMCYVRFALQHKVPYIFDPAFNIPHFSKAALVRAIRGALIVIGNDYEISLLQKNSGMGETAFFGKDRIVVTTLGGKGSVIRKGQQVLKIPPAKPKNTSDPTGAGDAYRAGFLAGYFRDLPLQICGRMGSVAAVYTVEKYGTQTHRFSLAQFKKRYSMNFGEKLDISGK